MKIKEEIEKLEKKRLELSRESYISTLFDKLDNLSLEDQTNEVKDEMEKVLDEILVEQKKWLNVMDEQNIAIDNLKTAIDNLKKFIREHRNNEYAFKEIYENLSNLNRLLQILPGYVKSNSEEKTNKEQKRDAILKKIFASTNTFEQVMKYAEQFSIAFNTGFEEVAKEEIIHNIQYIDADLIQDSSNILVVRVNGQEAMAELGCTSMWCFARPSSEDDWEEYALLGYVFIIYNFSKDFEDLALR